MSSEAVAWAFKSDVKPSSVKFTLVALCECANYQTGKIFPSIKHLCQITGQDRKTVISNIGKLVAEGWIDETGERVGRTGQIKVYQANVGTVPNMEQSQERNSSVSPFKESQKRDTEPSREPSSKKNISAHEMPDDWEPMSFKVGSASRDIVDSWPTETYVPTLEAFVAYHRSRGNKFKNWQDAWSNWVLNSRKFKNGTTNRTTGKPRNENGFAAALRYVADGRSDDPF
jgi:DNA-binding transcriptional MocR family regulator